MRAHNRVRRLGIALAVSAVSLVTLDGPAVAERGSDRPLNRVVDGPITGAGIFDFSTPGCDAHSTHRFVFGAGRPPSRSGTMDAEFCVSFADFPLLRGTGTFVLTTHTGATLSGTQVSTNLLPNFTVTYTVTGGTRQFKHVGGTFVHEGLETVSGMSLSNVGTLSGSLTKR